MSESSTAGNFYWQSARDELLTPAALNLFQIAAKYDGEIFDEAKSAIDEEYAVAVGGDLSRRHGGNFQTFVRVFEEAGWMMVDLSDEQGILRVTPAGRQALALLKSAPDFLKAVPYFLVDLLARYQLNNPAGPPTARNLEIREATKQSNIFPYWTVWRIMRSCDDRVTTDELKRFVFRLQRFEDVDATIQQIKAFRRDLAGALPEDELNKKYPPPIKGAWGESKYIMGRAGMHIGKHPPLIDKEDRHTYVLKPSYHRLIDEVLRNEPVYRDYIDADTWFRDYGQPVLVEEEFWDYSVLHPEDEGPLPYMGIGGDDPVWVQVRDLVRMGSRNIVFVGPPGTSKTTYALSIGAKLVEYDRRRFHNIQFHQSFSYDDFVIGYVPSDQKDRESGFVLRRKVFLQACDAAKRDSPSTLHVLVIDELNRGDPSRVLGEALTYIERRGEQFELAYEGRIGQVPSNLVILATLNPYDKSIADIDQALDRRFTKITMQPDSRILREILVNSNGMDQALADHIVSFFEFLISQVPNRFGQAYFKDARDVETLHKVWRHHLLPVLEKELRYDKETLDRIVERFERDFPGSTSNREIHDTGAGRNAEI